MTSFHGYTQDLPPQFVNIQYIQNGSNYIKVSLPLHGVKCYKIKSIRMGINNNLNNKWHLNQVSNPNIKKVVAKYTLKVGLPF